MKSLDLKVITTDNGTWEIHDDDGNPIKDPRHNTGNHHDLALNNSAILANLPFQGTAMSAIGLMLRQNASGYRGLDGPIVEWRKVTINDAIIDNYHPMLRADMDITIHVDNALMSVRQQGRFVNMQKYGGQNILEWNILQAAAFAEAQNMNIDMVAFTWLTSVTTYTEIAWARDKFPVLRLTLDQAAAMATTSASDELIGEVQPPWDTFLISVPAGLISIPQVEDMRGCDELDLRWIMVHSRAINKKDVQSLRQMGVPATAGDRRWYWYGFTDVGPCMYAATNLSTRELLGAHVQEDAPARDARNLQLIGQMIVSACFELTQGKVAVTHKRPKGTNAMAWAKKHKAHEYTLLPDVRVYPGLAAEVHATSLARGPVSVRTIVRRHRKRQPCGKGRMDRKIIVVEPYERGPRGASIGIRQHAIEK
jgi:hypothetical protein